MDGSFEVPVSEYDGKITYGERRRQDQTVYTSHVDELASSVSQLIEMERLAQSTYLKMRGGGKWFM